MIALVAIVVALVILVFFGIGYALRPGVPVEPPSAYYALGHTCTTLAIFGINNRQRCNTAASVALLILGVLVSGADLLDVRRRPPPDRRSAARRLRDARVALPVRRDDRLPDRAPAGVPRRRAPARARDDRPPRRGSRASTTSCARTATTRSRRTTCAARAACASSRSAATRARSRSTRRGASARSARPRRTRRRRPRRAAGAAQTTDQPTVAAERRARRSWPSPRPTAGTGETSRVADDADTLPRHGTHTDPGQAGRVRARPDRARSSRASSARACRSSPLRT